MGNIVDTIKRFSSNGTTAVPVQRCSDLSIGTSRLDRCTCTGNGISVTGKTASASKGGNINGCKDFCEEVPNEGMHMTPGSASTKGCLGDIDLLNLPMVHARPSGSDEGDKEKETPNETFHVRELGCVDHSEKSAGHIFHNFEDESTETPRSLCKVSAEGNINLADEVENSPATDVQRAKEFILNRVSPADGLFDGNVCEVIADDVLDSGYKSNTETEVSLDGQRHEQRIQHKSLNYDVVPNEVIAASASLDISNPKSPLKRRAKRQRTTKASSQTLVPKENTGTLVPSDQICMKIVNQSPLTCSKSKAPSITTPESVKMKRSRSGRVIVPRLDPGCQNIIYDPDGCISGITNLEAQFPQGISSAPPYKRRSRRLSPDDTRLLTFY